MIRWPSGSAVLTYFAATAPPAPRRFSTITDWPRLAASLSDSTRAIVSDAAPGDTPEISLTVLLGNVCAASALDNNRNTRPTSFLIASSLCFRQPELSGQPVRGAAAVAVRTVVGIVAAVLDDHQLDRPRHRLRELLGVRCRHQPILPAGDDEDRAGDARRRFLHRKRFRHRPSLHFIFRMAAYAEGLARELGQPVPDAIPFVGTRQRDARLDAFFVCCGAGRVVAAE